MGASRKLQGEIDRVLKKVQEGVDVFDSIWNKVYDTENANQKEKFEADLKKEIKKLQRYRDQIKSWIQSSEIKDKKALMDARKLIEREMERFKVCEKETKTKAFSKEGLGQQPKTDPREKAKSETRDWLNNFVSDLENQIDTFEAEIEGLSIKKGKNRPPRLTHLEKSITRHKAHIKKLESILRLLDNDELSPEQVNDVRDFIEDYVERNQDDFDEFSDVEDLYTTLPVEKVEALEDMVSSLGPVTLAKGAAPVSTAKSSAASSSVQVTIPPTPSQDGTEDASLPSLEDKTSPSSEPSVPRTPPAKTSHTSSPVLTPSPVPSPRTNSSVPVFSRSNSNSDAPAPAVVKEDDVSIKKAAPAVVVKPAVPPGLTLGNPALKTVMSGGDGANSPRSPMGNRVGVGSDVAGSGAADGVAGGARVLATATATAQPVVAVSAAAAAQWRPQTPAVTFPPQNETMRGRAEIAPDQREQYVQRLQQVQQAKQQQQQQQQQQQNNNISVTMPPNITSSQKPTAFPATSSASQAQTQAQQNLLMQQANYYQGVSYRPFVTQNLPNSSAQGVTLQTTDSSKTEEQPLQQQDDTSPKSNTNSRISEEDLIKSPRPGSSSMEGQLADLSPGQPLQQPTNQVNLGVIGRRSATSAPPEDNFDQVNALQLLEAAFYKLPQAKDSERAKTYVPRHPIVTPASYPQVQSPTVSNPALWERLAYDSLGTDTLFFAFYYQQNSYQQYLAARELKKNSWRYHRKYNTWFQRHEEPKVTTDEFEKGSYVYFDFHVTDDSSGWCQRIKNEFVFEYNYLEDELAV